MGQILSDALRNSRNGASRENLAAAVLLLLQLVAVPFLLASSAKAFSDGDVSWHIAAGQWMIHHHAIPIADPFSFTRFGHPWVAMEWLGDVVYAAAFAAAGFAGCAAVVAAVLIALQIIVYAHIRHRVGVIGIAATIAAMDMILGAFVLARPHVLVWPILAAWTVLLLRSLETGQPPTRWSLLLLVLWTNIHGSFPIALLIAAGIAFDSLRHVGWRTWPQWAVFLGLSGFALLLNANGLSGVLQPFRIMSLHMLPTIVEWQPSSPSVSPQFYIVLLLVLGFLLWRGVTVPLGQLLLLLVLSGLAFSQARHQEWLAIAGALILPANVGSEGWRKSKVEPLILVGAAAVALRACLPLQLPDSAAIPGHLIGAVPMPLRNQPVLNGYTFGGTLILAGIPTYIDGRADMYGDAFMTNYTRMLDGDRDSFNDAVRRYNIKWTMLPHADQRLIDAIESGGGWTRLYSDPVGVIDVRTGADRQDRREPPG